MKKILLILFAVCSIFGMNAAKPQDFILYINPGHGGHDSDDRNVVIPPFKQGDPEGYWESNSNLSKGLSLIQLLKDRGYKVHISRTTNTSADDLNLSTICELANNSNADVFLSIHSNATGTGSRVNYPLSLFRGYDNDPVFPAAYTFGEIINEIMYTNDATVWSHHSKYVRGDWSFHSSWGDKVGLGVLRTLNMQGVLSEGSFHDYIPETYRLMSDDFCWVEAWHFVKAFERHLNITPNTGKGIIAGVIYDSRFKRDESYVMYGRDYNRPLVEADVTLTKADGTEVAKYKTSYLPNGFYLFKDLLPGDYKIKVVSAGHIENVSDVSVVAEELTYHNIPVMKVRDTAPEVVEFTPNTTEAVPCNSVITMKFNWDMDVASTEAAFKITPAATGKLEWSESNMVLTYTPDATVPFKPNTEYTVTLAKSAQHAGGMSMKSDFVLKFKTDSRDHLKVLSQWPNADAEVHVKAPVVYLVTDAPLDAPTAYKNIVVKDEEGNVLSRNARATQFGKSDEAFGWVKIPLMKSLVDGKKYTVTYPNNILDNVGIPVRESKTFNFVGKDLSKVAAEGAVLVEGFDNATLYAVNAEQTKAATAKISKDGSSKLFGAGDLNLKYEFGENDNKVVIDLNTVDATKVFTTDDVAELHVFGDMSGNTVNLILKGSASTIEIPMCELNFFGWQSKKVNLAEFADKFVAGEKYNYAGVSLVRNAVPQSIKGTVKFENLNLHAGKGAVEIVENTSFTVYPNPATELIIANGDDLIHGIELFNLEGKMVKRQAGNVMNVSDVANGTYVVRIHTYSQTVNKKIVISH